MKERVPFCGKAQRAGLKLRDRCEYGLGKVTPEPPTDDPRCGKVGSDGFPPLQGSAYQGYVTNGWYSEMTSSCLDEVIFF